MLEKTWNRSFRVMYNLPLETHRYFVEPISRKPHARNMIMKRFLRFTELIMKSNKKSLIHVFKMIRRDVQSVTGNNLRKMMMMTGKSDIEDLCADDISKAEYAPIPLDEKWRIDLLDELIDVKYGNSKVENLNNDEIDDLIQFVCSS